MSVRSNEQRKIELSVADIASGHFDERTVDHVFMALREHAGRHSVFREVADFVAHSDLRDRGITNRSLVAFYLVFKYFTEYVSPRTPLDITKPFPSYILKLMRYQVDKCKEEGLRRRFNVTKDGLKTRIAKLFKEDRKSETAYLTTERLTDTTFAALRYILGFIDSHPAFTQGQILSELAAVLTENDIPFDEVAWAGQGDRIMLCVLTLLHNTEYDLGGEKEAYCKVSCDSTVLQYGVRFVDAAGDEVQFKETYGTLQLQGLVTVNNKGTDVTVSFPVVTTTLKVEDWCEESMFSIEPVQGGPNAMSVRRVNFDGDLGVSRRFRLEPTRT